MFNKNENLYDSNHLGVIKVFNQSHQNKCIFQRKEMNKNVYLGFSLRGCDGSNH